MKAPLAGSPPALAAVDTHSGQLLAAIIGPKTIFINPRGKVIAVHTGQYVSQGPPRH